MEMTMRWYGTGFDTVTLKQIRQMLSEVCPIVSGIKLGDCDSAKKITPILQNSKIWGVDLYEVGLADKVASYFEELTAGVGAVRRTLEKYTK